MSLNTDLKVLVVDDFATMRKIIKNILTQLGFKNILEADDGSSALELLKKEKIDLIISDWNMPKMSGLDLLKAVRNDPNLKDILFVMVTAEAQKDNVIEAIKHGVNQYIVKPFTPETLKEKLEKVLGG
ncbi:MAG: Response regulator receiver protein [Thermodesulfobacterium sp. 37_54]|uniref:Histidine kinase n=2 Tax=Thermodesulfobacterium commune TaxID=1741 RepID=A0A075WRW4_9BACT|nr:MULTISPECIES: chemotaxis response regulator CheY [Thermodesulfobacterium]KUJ97128.1 MAG: Response regulator receiver protein [Thermodesulfobacterium sp. 37_54]KUK18873.1 MAG: Response regulator receiver protein [Thermodesulfobacterium commune]AIH03770.1 histidine kinase [Thermodesulfobacterium commune DSM 2178]KUK37568.1 MAG: Response regulator receiver protein [Thermodesulfobacterium commune]HAA84223.1 response regulator [Thermodesulfobacterium commune]